MKNQYFETLPVSALYTDKFNRPVQVGNTAKMAREFNLELVGAITVSLRENGAYVIIDGQNRTEAAKIAGIKMLPCDVRTGLTYEEEAVLFVELNKKRKGVPAVHIFNGEKEGKIESAVEIDRIVKSAGFTISAGQGRGLISAIGVISEIYARHGGAVLESALRVIAKAWAYDCKATHGTIIQGLCEFMTIYKGEFDEARLIGVLQKVVPMSIIARVSADASTRSKKRKSAAVIFSFYNKGLVHKLPERF